MRINHAAVRAMNKIMAPLIREADEQYFRDREQGHGEVSSTIYAELNKIEEYHAGAVGKRFGLRGDEVLRQVEVASYSERDAEEQSWSRERSGVDPFSKL